METLTTVEPQAIDAETHVITTYIPLPNLGILPANAFVIRGATPALIDAGVVAAKEEFMERLQTVIEPRDLRWIWLTHADPDHWGALAPLLDAAPNARVVTTYLGLGKLGLHRAWPPERFYLLNPGQRLELGDRELMAMSPPTYDAPETTAVFDTASRIFFSADSFGGVLSAPAKAAEEIEAAELREGIVTWTGIDSPWLRRVEEAVLRRALAIVDELRPSWVASSHLPPARGITRRLLDHVEEARTAAPFAAPDQAAFEALARP